MAVKQDLTKEPLMVYVFSVISLSYQELDFLKGIFKKTFSQFTLKNIIDKKLIAGLKIQVGDKIFDFSYAGKLRQLRPIVKEFFTLNENKY